ncbi:MAG: glycosyltransferase, partial [Bacteroidota bacterium]
GWRQDVDTVMSGLDIVALTSWNEGTPVSLIEAQAAGKPIVSTDVGGIENAVIKDETALLVKNGDADSFHSALKKLISDSELRNSMASKGWPFVKDRFHYTRLAKETGNLYRQLLNKKGIYLK